jgi:hypothetical protein
MLAIFQSARQLVARSRAGPRPVEDSRRLGSASVMERIAALIHTQHQK